MRVDPFDGAEGIGHEIVVVDVDELSGIVPGARGGELLEPPGPQLELALTDDAAPELLRPPFRRLFRQAAHRRDDRARRPVGLDDQASG